MFWKCCNIFVTDSTRIIRMRKLSTFQLIFYTFILFNFYYLWRCALDKLYLTCVWLVFWCCCRSCCSTCCYCCCCCWHFQIVVNFIAVTNKRANKQTDRQNRTEQTAKSTNRECEDSMVIPHFVAATPTRPQRPHHWRLCHMSLIICCNFCVSVNWHSGLCGFYALLLTKLQNYKTHKRQWQWQCFTKR